MQLAWGLQEPGGQGLGLQTVGNIQVHGMVLFPGKGFQGLDLKKKKNGMD